MTHLDTNHFTVPKRNYSESVKMIQRFFWNIPAIFHHFIGIILGLLISHNKKQSVWHVYGKSMLVYFLLSHINTIYTLWRLYLHLRFRVICGLIDSLQRTSTKNDSRTKPILSFSTSFPQKEEH